MKRVATKIKIDNYCVSLYPGDTPRKAGGGVCRPLPQTLTPFMTKVCDFCHPIYDLAKNLIVFLIIVKK